VSRWVDDDSDATRTVAKTARIRATVGDARFFLVYGTKTGKNVPNEHKIVQNVHKIVQMALKHIKIIQSTALQNLLKLGFLVWLLSGIPYHSSL
jgi:hypothetical protein